MGIRYDWMREAAFEAKGREWRNVIVAFEIAVIVAPYVALVALVAGAGLLARQAWLAISDALDPADTVAVSATVDPGPSLGSVPSWLWITLVLLLCALGWIFRPGQLRTSLGRRTRVIQVATVVIALAGVIGMIFASLHGG